MTDEKLRHTTASTGRNYVMRPGRSGVFNKRELTLQQVRNVS